MTDNERLAKLRAAAEPLRALLAAYEVEDAHRQPLDSRGPWRAGEGDSCSVVDARGEIVAIIYGNVYTHIAPGQCVSNAKDNRRLVAAAPTMLAALRESCGFLRGFIRDRALAAIAAAGEAPPDPPLPVLQSEGCGCSP